MPHLPFFDFFVGKAYLLPSSRENSSGAQGDPMMNNLYLRTVLAGIFFAFWPLCLNRSGLSGHMSSACFSLATLLCVMPFALQSNGLAIPSADWKMVVFAGIFSALGLLSFSDVLARVSPRNLGTFFVIMNLVQFAVVATSQAITTGSLPPQRLAGYAFAAIATYLLVR